jgi:hypothetical protein
VASKEVKGINRTYKQRHVQKGLGFYARQPAGVGPMGVHSDYMKPCFCGGCSSKRARAA